MRPVRSIAPRWLGVLLGLALAAFDTGVARLAGFRFELAGRNATAVVWLYLAGTFAVLGYALGWLVESRRRERRMQESLDLAQARVAQELKLAALGQLAAAVAHEVRNPLAIIRSSVQNLAEGVPADDPAQECSRYVLEEVDRLDRVVSSILAFARPLRVEPRPASAAEILDRTAALARRRIAPRRLDLRCEAAGGLPDLRLDPDLACQALLALVDNAARVSPEGGQIVLEARPAPAGVEFAVGDRGPGVPAELRARVLEPFFTTRDGGHGLGLAIVRQIAEAHGGRVEVGDNPGGGARVSIRFPAGGRAA